MNAKTRKGLYQIEKPKGKKERFVYLSKEVVQELKKNNWQPNQTNRHNFYHFLRKIKRELNLPTSIELSPHTLRRAFTTYHAESGVPLPILQKLLGHSSIRTTALYWQNIYGEDDTSDILAGKKWLERQKPSQSKKPPKVPITENLPEPLPKFPDSDILRNEPVITAEKPSNLINPLPTAKTEKNPIITNYQPQKLKGLYQKSLQSFSKLCISEISPKAPKKFFLDTSKQLPLITDREQTTSKEQILLIKIKQLEEQLAKVQVENSNLKLENKHLKALIKKDQATEAKILQSLPLKIKT